VILIETLMSLKKKEVVIPNPAIAETGLFRDLANGYRSEVSSRTLFRDLLNRKRRC